MAVAGSMPTVAELDAEFPAAGDGFAAYIDAGGSGTDFFHVWRQNGEWVGVTGTKLT